MRSLPRCVVGTPRFSSEISQIVVDFFLRASKLSGTGYTPRTRLTLPPETPDKRLPVAKAR